MLKKIKSWRQDQFFLPSPLGMIVSPIYIIRRNLYKAIRKISNSISGDILDFGCGSKPYESLFKNAKSYIGVDLEASGHKHKDSKVDFFYDGVNLPFPDEKFDAIVAFEVFEHIFNIDDVLLEIKRVMRPSAHILLTIPFAWDEHEIPYDYARYTSYGIRHILEKSGFSVISIDKSTTYFLAASQMLIAYLAQHVSPRGNITSKLFQAFFIFPITFTAVLFNKILPKRYDYYCNSIILCKKI